MSLIVTAAGRRRITLPATCTIPTYEGSGETIHPSVVDMVAETGTPFSGYRWWMANTPMPGGSAAHENPCIWGSNDRINWVEPVAGLNPIDTAPSDYYSDTELVWDPDNSRLVCVWRYSPAVHELRSAHSVDGTTWTLNGTLVVPGMASNMSPTIVREGANSWRMWLFGGSLYPESIWTASDPTGTWIYVGDCSGSNGRHGDFIEHEGVYIGLVDYGGLRASTDGVTWVKGAAPTGLQTVGTSYAYRSTLAPSTVPDHIDVWASWTGTHHVEYHRFPGSLWTDLLA